MEKTQENHQIIKDAGIIVRARIFNNEFFEMYQNLTIFTYEALRQMEGLF